MYEMGEQLERVILAGVQTYESDDTVQSLYELRELAETAGAVTVGTIMQSRETIHPATYLGKGKLEELKELLYDLDATGVICDDELSPAQLNNLEQELECKVMDRTMVILDIFEPPVCMLIFQLKFVSAGTLTACFPKKFQSRLIDFGRRIVPICARLIICSHVPQADGAVPV